MGLIASLLDVGVLFFLVSPVFIRFLIVRAPLSLRGGSLLAIIYGVLPYSLFVFSSVLRVIVYLNEPFRASFMKSDYIDHRMIFMDALCSSVIAVLFFYLGRFIMRIGYKKYDYDKTEAKNTHAWWNSIWKRQIAFFVILYIMTFASELLQVVATVS